MTKTTTRNHNHDDDASKRKIKTCDKGGLVPWSDLNHDVMFLVMMQLGVVDFFAFSRVCKSWRSLALCNKKMFMASRPPMYVGISTDSSEKEYYYPVVIEERTFKTQLPYSAARTWVGLSCGYLVFYGQKTRDFWLVNPIRRHQLHFPGSPVHVYGDLSRIKFILVFSPSINRWVFVVLVNNSSNLWFCIAGKGAGKGAWNHVCDHDYFIDLHAFNGKIYTLNTGCRVCELRVNLEPKLTLLEINNFPKKHIFDPVFVRSDDKLGVMDYCRTDYRRIRLDTVHELDFGEMKWSSPKEKKIEESVYVIDWQRGADTIAPPYVSIAWYFPEHLMNIDLINE